MHNTLTLSGCTSAARFRAAKAFRNISSSSKDSKCAASFVRQRKQNKIREIFTIVSFFLSVLPQHTYSFPDEQNRLCHTRRNNLSWEQFKVNVKPGIPSKILGQRSCKPYRLSHSKRPDALSQARSMFSRSYPSRPDCCGLLDVESERTSAATLDPRYMDSTLASMDTPVACAVLWVSVMKNSWCLSIIRPYTHQDETKLNRTCATSAEILEDT